MLILAFIIQFVTALLIAWAAFDSGYDLGWRYHSEGKANYKLWDVLRNKD